MVKLCNTTSWVKVQIISQKQFLDNQQFFDHILKSGSIQELWTGFHPDQWSGSRLMDFINLLNFDDIFVDVARFVQITHLGLNESWSNSTINQ